MLAQLLQLCCSLSSYQLFVQWRIVPCSGLHGSLAPRQSQANNIVMHYGTATCPSLMPKHNASWNKNAERTVHYAPCRRAFPFAAILLLWGQGDIPVKAPRKSTGNVEQILSAPSCPPLLLCVGTR